MQTSINFQNERQAKVQQLGRLERIVRMLFEEDPSLIDIKRTNDLVRTVWRRYEDISCESITRVARKLRASGEYDTLDNVQHRANMEVAYRDYNNN